VNRPNARGIGVVAAANFSIGAVLFEAIAADAARRLAARSEFGAFLHETHHDKKIDAPSGTALSVKAAMEAAGYSKKIDVASTRVGFVPRHPHRWFRRSVGEHHAHAQRARPRHVCRGALLAATWVKGQAGWFTMRDVLGLDG
jgi:4-hydroxy-tetrahydrodipicolinate reductase